MAENKISIELSPKEAEILLGALANIVPADRSHEITIFSLYVRIRDKYEKFLRE